ncbi:3-deoxy-D-manno-octulosonic acid transferase [Desulfobulbus sp.]|uniref:3-deoxy-D-manno-octulosonic acid transferase n=1 Tax=Desulfobulbus sp. TaxID=895 RepID=UPI0027B9A49B|nr:3-deoxy-D-manno-octulosonic acid transferase [Desulfobulbus sp.]
MSLLYNMLSAFLLLLLLPLLPFILGKKKYRRRIGRRLGWGLAGQLPPLASESSPTFWIHALSVGEVTSALPLARGLRDAFPAARIVFSAATRSGGEVAAKLLSPHVDALIAAPLDLGPVVPFFARTIRPDLFILVETDFWPHWLHCLKRRHVPTLLVNGRISERSFVRYQRFSGFFRPMFRSFSLLSMQTGADAAKMVALGVEERRVLTLGNLKFDTSQVADQQTSPGAPGLNKERYGFSAHAPLWICGSTHRGEEELIFRVHRRLLTTLPNLQLLIAPRNIERAGEIVALGATHQCACRRWTDGKTAGPALILDTIGELAGCYPMAETVFVGGSLVPEGGHNPIEPAAARVPVLFGPHMEDFAEIAQQLVECGGARRIDAADALAEELLRLLTNPVAHDLAAAAASACVRANRGVVGRHIDAVNALLAGTQPGP